MWHDPNITDGSGNTAAMYSILKDRKVEPWMINYENTEHDPNI